MAPECIYITQKTQQKSFNFLTPKRGECRNQKQKNIKLTKSWGFCWTQASDVFAWILSYQVIIMSIYI